jgi:hypothetical protein
MVFSAKRIVILSIEISGGRAERAPAHRLRRPPPDRPGNSGFLGKAGSGLEATPEGISPTVAREAPD